MSLQSALNYGALDTTYQMIANMRYPFGIGIIEDRDTAKRGYLTQDAGDVGTGYISIAPFSVINSQGVVIWDTDPTRVNAGQSGIFYIALYSIRTPSSPLITSWEVLSSLPVSDDYMVFGEVIMTGGDLNSVDYTNKMSLKQVGHNNFKGIVTSLPDLSPGGDIIGSQAGADVNTGDTFITIVGTTAYLHIADRATASYRVMTLSSTTGDANCWGSGATQICIDGTAGTLKVGAVTEQIQLNGVTGAITGKSLAVSENIEANRVITSYLRAPSLYGNVKLGNYPPDGIAGSANLLPTVPNEGTIGSLSSPFAIMYALGMASQQFSPLTASATVGYSGANGSFAKTYTKEIESETGIVTVNSLTVVDSIGIIPSADTGTHQCGQSANRWSEVNTKITKSNLYEDGYGNSIGVTYELLTTVIDLHTNIPSNPVSRIWITPIGTNIIMYRFPIYTVALLGNILYDELLFTIPFPLAWPFTSEAITYDESQLKPIPVQASTRGSIIRGGLSGTGCSFWAVEQLNTSEVVTANVVGFFTITG